MSKHLFNDVRVPIEEDNLSICRDESKCIKCGACIKKCPKNARYYDDPSLISHKEMLEKNYTRRAEPEIFI